MHSLEFTGGSLGKGQDLHAVEASPLGPFETVTTWSQDLPKLQKHPDNWHEPRIDLKSAQVFRFSGSQTAVQVLRSILRSPAAAVQFLRARVSGWTHVVTDACPESM